MSLAQSPNLETKIALHKNPTVAGKIASRRLKIVWGFGKHLVNLRREFMKRVTAISLI